MSSHTNGYVIVINSNTKVDSNKILSTAEDVNTLTLSTHTL